MIQKTARHGYRTGQGRLQLNFHAIGDRANRIGSRRIRSRTESQRPAIAVTASNMRKSSSHGLRPFWPTQSHRSMQPSHQTRTCAGRRIALGPRESRAPTPGNHAQEWSSPCFRHRLQRGSYQPVPRLVRLRDARTPDGGPKNGWEPQEKISLDDCSAHTHQVPRTLSSKKVRRVS